MRPASGNKRVRRSPGGARRQKASSPSASSRNRAFVYSRERFRMIARSFTAQTSAIVRHGRISLWRAAQTTVIARKDLQVLTWQSVPLHVRFMIASLLEPHIPSARIRLQIIHILAIREGEEEESPTGDSGCPTRAAHKRTGRGPLVNHPGQRRVPRLWTPPPSGSTSCMIRKLRSMGAKRCHTRITWPHQVSGTDHFEARSTPLRSPNS